MSHVFFREELEGVATFWRIHRRDGITLGFSSHDRDLWFGGIRHRAAPGILPSAIRRSADFRPDSAQMEGALSHDSIAPGDLAAGLFDGASVEVGAVDWETLDHAVLFSGSIGQVSQEANGFTAELLSSKHRLEADHVPRTSPTCRARFCGPECGLSAARFTREGEVQAVDSGANSVTFAAIDPALYVAGELRWVDGPQAGQIHAILQVAGNSLVLDRPLDPQLPIGTRALLREGCDHTLETCRSRFANGINFRGEPYLPGNDLLARYPLPR